MQKGYHLKCIKRNDGVNTCILPLCKQNPIMCDNTNCQCQKKHMKCMGNTSISKIWKGLKTKGCSYLPIFKQIYQWYEVLSKRINIQMIQIKTQIDNSQPTLLNEQEILFKHMKDGKSQQITSQLMYKVISSIFNQDKYNVQVISSQVKKSLDDISNEINKSLDKIKVLNQKKDIISQIRNDNLKFSRQLHHQVIQIIDDYTIKSTRYDGTYKAALIEVNLKQNSKCRFLMIKTIHRQVFYGVCQLNNTNYTGNNIFNTISNGVFLNFNSQQSDYFGESTETKKLKDEIKLVEAGDIIQIQYISNTNHVTFKNINKSTTNVYAIKTQIHIPFYFCVLLANQNDEIKLINVQ